jgi:hypothetical protein
MIDFSFIIAIALTLLFLLWVVWRRETNNGSAAGGGFPDPSEYLVRLPKRALLDRCLSPEDVEFAAMLRSPALLRLLVYERRRLALAWLRQTRREAVRLFRLHVRTVRHASGLRPLAEAKLFSAVGLFLIVHGVMVGSVCLYGPFRTRRFLESLRLLADLLSRLGGRIAESIGPGLVPQMNSMPGGR